MSENVGNVEYCRDSVFRLTPSTITGRVCVWFGDNPPCLQMFEAYLI